LFSRLGNFPILPALPSGAGSVTIPLLRPKIEKTS
jgi:hypothetical protein